MAEPFVELHPLDARAHSIHPASLVRLSNLNGNAVVRALVTDRQRRGHIFVPMHWTEQFASNARVDVLVSSKVDPTSGQPALKMAQAFVEPMHAKLFGFFVANRRPVLDTTYWAIAEAPGGFRGELGWSEAPVDDVGWLRRAFGLADEMSIVNVMDARSGRRSFAAFENGRLVVALYLSPDPVLVSRQWAVDLLARENLDGPAVLAGRPRADTPDAGAVVCSCFGVGILTITNAVLDQGCTTVDAVGAFTRAGTNCGSCRPEIRGIIDAHRLAAAE